MLEIVQLLARTLDLQSIQLSWEIKPTPEEVLDYWFEVLRSEAEGGPWQEMTGRFEDRYLYLDNQVEATNPLRSLFYTLRVTRKSDPRDTQTFGPVSVGDEPDLIALEIRRTWDVTLHELNGRRCWLFPVRTFGSTCKNCYDNITQRVTNSSCPSCFGTGFARGFHHPIEMWMRFMPIPSTAGVGTRMQAEAPAAGYAGAFPSVKWKDLIVEPNNRRWRVGKVKVTERLGTILHQELDLAEVAIGDPEFNVPVNITNLSKLAIAAERNYRYRTTVD